MREVFLFGHFICFCFPTNSEILVTLPMSMTLSSYVCRGGIGSSKCTQNVKTASLSLLSPIAYVNLLLQPNSSNCLVFFLFNRMHPHPAPQPSREFCMAHAFTHSWNAPSRTLTWRKSLFFKFQLKPLFGILPKGFSLLMELLSHSVSLPPDWVPYAITSNIMQYLFLYIYACLIFPATVLTILWAFWLRSYI